MELDRITLNFGKSELPLAAEIRKLAGERGLNRWIKQAIREYLDRQNGQKIS